MVAVQSSNIERFLPREFLGTLEAWAKEGGCPILLSGWRQVGKSTGLAHFGENNFDDVYHVNFAMDPALSHCFAEPNPKLVLAKLESRRSRKIVPGKTLLILDEIQDCPQAIEVLGHFKDVFPKLHVIACGTFVDFSQQSVGFNIPVGRIKYLTLHPMSFREFLLAIDEQALYQIVTNYSWETVITTEQHRQLLTLVKDYMMVGGMPDIVSTYVQSGGSWEAVREQQRELWRSMRDTFSNMMQDSPGENSEQLLLKMLSAISNEVQDLSQLSTRIDKGQLQEALNRVFQSGLFARINAIPGEHEKVFLPINSDEIFRTVFIDIGLLYYALTCDKEGQQLKQPMEEYGGMLARQYVGQHLWQQSEGSMGLKYPRFLQQGSVKFDFSHGNYGFAVGTNPHSLFHHHSPTSIGDIQVGMDPLLRRGSHLICPLYLMEQAGNLADTAMEQGIAQLGPTSAA